MNPPFTVYSVAMSYGRVADGKQIIATVASVLVEAGVEPLMDEEVWAKAEAQNRDKWTAIMSEGNAPPAYSMVYSDWHILNGRNYVTTVFKEEFKFTLDPK
jgi:hypothetical protein